MNNNNTENTENTRSPQMLKEMQSWPLDKKIQVSLAKIAEFYNRFPDKIYVLSLRLFIFLLNTITTTKDIIAHSFHFVNAYIYLFLYIFTTS